jgi:hypothetical protein
MKKSLIVAMAAIALIGLSANKCGGSDQAEQKPADQTTTTPPADQTTPPSPPPAQPPQ